MKKYAYYLPQFHEISENNEWWGKGFTEWTNVRQANPLYKNHCQPVHPLNNNYYCLDDSNTLKWQSQLMTDYCIDGMIFYHYYFCGKKLLEKPAELLLKNKDIDMDFFFCWANHSWFRSWEGSKELLIDQVYGEEKEWEEHFQYLIPFFKDERYEKRNKKPLLMIYKYEFDKFERIFNYFDNRCRDEGFDGLYVIISETNYQTIEIDHGENKFKFEYTYCLREPDTALIKFRKNFVRRVLKKLGTYSRKIGTNFTESYNGDRLYRIMLNKKFGKKVIRGLYFSFDNTPRHGYRGFVINEPSKQSFLEYMDLIKENEYVFINAWNEWCEGMMLEPTEENGYKYLEWIKEWSELNENRTNRI